MELFFDKLLIISHVRYAHLHRAPLVPVTTVR